jgi:hypothetical protein
VWQYHAYDGSWLRLCKVIWDNPAPKSQIERIELNVRSSSGVPLVLAITTEP